MPHPDSTGSFQQIQDDQLSDKRWETPARHREENATRRTSQTGRSNEGGHPVSKRTEVTCSLAVEMGNQGHTTLVLGGEWAMGPFAQPRVHADLRGTTHSKLLHVQSPTWNARGIPGTKDNWDMDQHPSQLEDMPSFWMAQESPINHRWISKQEGHSANNGPISSKAIAATGTPAGSPPGHVISGRPGGGTGCSTNSMASMVSRPEQGQGNRWKMYILRLL